MIRGTTAQFKFKLPYNKGELGWATIKFWQQGNSGIGGTLPITKRLEDCSGPEDAAELCVSLSPEETMRFSDKAKARVQLRAFNPTEGKNGTVFASHIQLITVYPTNDEILKDDEIGEVENDKEGYIILDGQSITIQ